MRQEMTRNRIIRTLVLIRQYLLNLHIATFFYQPLHFRFLRNLFKLNWPQFSERYNFKNCLRALSLSALMIIVFSSPCYAARNQALLIGISQYTELNSLRYADADASELSQLLIDFAGYEKSDVTLLLNQQATKNKIVDELTRVVRASEKQPLDTFIFVFAGHGVESTLSAHNVNGGSQDRATNIFLAPSDASTEENDFYSEGNGKQVSNDTFINKAWLARQLSAIQAKSIIVILDSCYSGTRSFGTLFLENEGYEVQSFGPSSGLQRGVAVTKRKLVLSQPSLESENMSRKVAYFASSRDDQASAEYEELRHGALSYCILEYIKKTQREVNSDATVELSIGDAYSNITKLFHETEVNGKALDEVHQPFLLSIPDYADIKNMAFLTVRGVKSIGIQNEGQLKPDMSKEEPHKEERDNYGLLFIATEPAGLEIYVDGEIRNEVTNASLKLPVGKHSVELYLPGTGYRFPFTADISASSPVSMNFVMHGDLEVTSFWLKDGVKSSGPPLDIYIDRTYVGKSQQRQDNLLAGTHSIEVRYQNVSKVRQIEIRPDSPLHINYSVIEEKAVPIDEKRIKNVVF